MFQKISLIKHSSLRQVKMIKYLDQVRAQDPLTTIITAWRRESLEEAKKIVDDRRRFHHRQEFVVDKKKNHIKCFRKSRSSARSNQNQSARSNDDDQSSTWRTHQCRWWWHYIFFILHFKQSFFTETWSVNSDRDRDNLRGVLILSIDLLSICGSFFSIKTSSVQFIFEFSNLFIQTNLNKIVSFFRRLRSFLLVACCGCGWRARLISKRDLLKHSIWFFFCQQQTLVDGEIIGDRQRSFLLLQDFLVFKQWWSSSMDLARVLDWDLKHLI